MMLRDGEQHDFDLFFNLEKLRWGAIRRVCPREPEVMELKFSVVKACYRKHGAPQCASMHHSLAMMATA